ncbi:MAG: glutamate--tRNA ligase [Hyphomicrobiales bacterium]|nr:glutamate--tRNA ligase [Hyphomicrobiales bacterium]
MTSPIVTRFAPSPTGFLHIGGARTALFNWLYARHHGGRFLLRIEDTDRERSTDAAIQAILDGLQWLGLESDGPPVMQFSRAARHREVAEMLLAGGRAYKCYATPAELEEMRALARAEGRAPRYDGRWRDRDPREAPAGAPAAIRLKAPVTGTTVIHDQVQGDVSFANKDLDDLVLLRSDGTPTYMLAVVVDDHDMGVTDIIRGDDHLTNAARQAQIYAALDWDLPRMAHIPLIHGPDGAKLSKRHGALGVEAYRDMGFLPAALRNYLVRLGWSAGDQEFFSTDEMIAAFSLEQIGRSAARFDFVKLGHINGHYMRATPDSELMVAVKALISHLPQGALFTDAFAMGLGSRLELALPGLKERARTLVELLDNARFLYAPRPLALDAKAAALLAGPAMQEQLERCYQLLSPLATWSASTTEAVMRDFAEAHGLKLGAVAQPLRAALTGSTVSPGVFDVMMALGRDESLARLQDQFATKLP